MKKLVTTALMILLCASVSWADNKIGPVEIGFTGSMTPIEIFLPHDGDPMRVSFNKFPIGFGIFGKGEVKGPVVPWLGILLYPISEDTDNSMDLGIGVEASIFEIDIGDNVAVRGGVVGGKRFLVSGKTVVTLGLGVNYSFGGDGDE